jgi:hypothetical protein
MAEYITKDDAQILVNLLDEKQYSLDEAKKFISIKERLQKYINDPDALTVDKKILK